MDPTTAEIVTKLTDDMVLEDAKKRKPTGRPTLLEEKLFTLSDLRGYYKSSGSIRKTAVHFQISPTTVKKYLTGDLHRPGRPVQGQAWLAVNRTPVHAWFVAHRSDPLPKSLALLAEQSGFSSRTISKYLYIRKAAVLAYVQSLPAPNEKFILFNDIMDRRLPSNLIKSYQLEIDRFDCAVRLICVLTMGGQRTVILPLGKYVEMVSG